VTLIYAATGRTAFGADAVPAVMHRILYSEPDLTGVPPSLLPLLTQCLAKDPLRRPTARNALIAIVDPSARQSLANSFDHATNSFNHTAFAGGAASGPVRTGPTSPLSGATTPAELLSDLPAPGGPTGPLPWPGAPGPRRRPWPILAAGAAALAALTVAGVLLIPKLTATSSSPPPPPTSQSQGSTPPASQASTTTAPSSPAPVGSGPQIPASFAGTWSGTAMQSAIADPQLQLPNTISFTFVGGRRTIHEVNQDCVNTLTLTKVTATVLTFDEPGVPGTCVAGTVTFTLSAKGLTYHWTDNIEQNIGVLSKG
jgi:hypothetical protein